MRLLYMCVIAVAATTAGVLAAQQDNTQALTVDACQLQADPPTYNHTLVVVSGLVSHGFEDFTLSDKKCAPRSFPIWLEYGGMVNSETVYCCGVTAGGTRDKVLAVEGLTLPLVVDPRFRRFDRRIRGHKADKGVTFRATLQGRFFSGKKLEWVKDPGSWGGYGHFGCCSLLVIQQVLAVQ